jgi:hypothetical protein
MKQRKRGLKSRVTGALAYASRFARLGAELISLFTRARSSRPLTPGLWDRPDYRDPGSCSRQSWRSALHPARARSCRNAPPSPPAQLRRRTGRCCVAAIGSADRLPALKGRSNGNPSGSGCPSPERDCHRLCSQIEADITCKGPYSLRQGDLLLFRAVREFWRSLRVFYYIDGSRSQRPTSYG